MQRIHSGNADGVNTSEIKIVTLRDLIVNCDASDEIIRKSKLETRKVSSFKLSGM